MKEFVEHKEFMGYTYVNFNHIPPTRMREHGEILDRLGASYLFFLQLP